MVNEQIKGFYRKSLLVLSLAAAAYGVMEVADYKYRTGYDEGFRKAKSAAQSIIGEYNDKAFNDFRMLDDIVLPITEIVATPGVDGKSDFKIGRTRYALIKECTGHSLDYHIAEYRLTETMEKRFFSASCRINEIRQ